MTCNYKSCPQSCLGLWTRLPRLFIGVPRRKEPLLWYKSITSIVYAVKIKIKTTLGDTIKDSFWSKCAFCFASPQPVASPLCRSLSVTTSVGWSPLLSFLVPLFFFFCDNSQRNESSFPTYHSWFKNETRSDETLWAPISGGRAKRLPNQLVALHS